MKHILVTGGAGYIGSHTVVELAAAGFRPVILDTFENSSKRVITNLKALTGQDISVIEGDFADTRLVQKACADHHIQGVIHFAAYKAVGESVAQPLKYYKNNVAGFIGLMEVLANLKVPIVLSSSAAVYGNPTDARIDETVPCLPTSPYGWSKLMDERILEDTCRGKARMKGIALRYFNVVGAHASGKIGELSKLPPQNLLPIIVQVAAGQRQLTVNGNDYETPDGTCLRDYVHVGDLAKAHIAALRHLLDQPKAYFDVFNVGTGKPTSVMELIRTFEQVNGVPVPFTMGARRPGDPQATCAQTDKITRKLGWKAEKTIEDAVASAWKWHVRIKSL